MNPLWKKILSGQLDPLLEAARPVLPGELGPLEQLRRLGNREEVSAVLSLWECRRKAEGRLVEPHRWWLTAEALQQATRSSVAEHKAQRMRKVFGEGPIIDLCCGIGSDAVELSRGGQVILVDRDRCRLELALANVEWQQRRGWALEADAMALPLRSLPMHIDPDRRLDGSRRHRYSQMLPGPPLLEALMERHPHTALKCGPGIDLDEIPSGEVEFIQDRGDLVEATLWRGDLDGGSRRRATLLPSGESISGDKEPLDVYSDERPGWLHEPIPVLERAGLIASLQTPLQLAELYPGLGWQAGDRPLDSPWFRSFEVIERMPWRVDKVSRWLRARGEGIAVVKTRGIQEDPTKLLRKFRGDGGGWTLALLRHGKKQVAWILAAATTPR